jgi:hypothetical protein
VFEIGHQFYDMPRDMREAIKKINKAGGRVLVELGHNYYIPATPWYKERIQAKTFEALKKRGVLFCSLDRGKCTAFDTKEWWDLSEEYQTTTKTT